MTMRSGFFLRLGVFVGAIVVLAAVVTWALQRSPDDPPAVFYRINPGMTIKEVKEVMGREESYAIGYGAPNGLLWSYGFRETDGSTIKVDTDEEGRVVRTEFEPLSHPFPKTVEAKLKEDYAMVLEDSEELEVFSIDPFHVGNKEANKEDTLRGYRVLGKTRVNDKGVRKQIANAIHRSVKDATGTYSAFCFDPRHVVRASTAGKQVDFVICFECVGMHVHGGPDDKYTHYPITKATKDILDDVLAKANIPIAP
jgi:hypothetical protein